MNKHTNELVAGDVILSQYHHQTVTDTVTSVEYGRNVTQINVARKLADGTVIPKGIWFYSANRDVHQVVAS